MIRATLQPKSNALRRLAAMIGFAWLFVATLQADSIRMPNGETLQGTITEESADHVTIRSVSFGEIRVARAPGVEIAHAASMTTTAPATKTAAPVTTSGSAPAPGAGHGPGGPAAPPPGLLQKWFGLSDRWSLELGTNLLVQNDKYHALASGTELTVGYRVPNATKPMQPRHECGLFAAYNYQRIDTTVVGENSELAARYFFQPLSPWLLVSQADWIVDRINGIASRSHALAIPSYRLLDTPKYRLLAGVGPSYLTDRRLVPISPVTNVEQTLQGFRIGFYELFADNLSPTLKFQQTLVILSRAQDPTTTYNLRFDASLSRQLSPHLMLNLDYDYVRDENTLFSPESIATLKLMLGYQF